MIVEDENLKYDAVNRFYYFTEAGMIKYTGKEYLVELWEISQGEAARRLKTHGRMLKNKYVESPYNGTVPRFRHRDLIEYFVFLDQHGERDAIIQSLTEMVYASEDIDWDKKVRVEEVKWLSMILQPISTVGVYYTGKLIGEVPEDEYQVDY